MLKKKKPWLCWW